MTEKKLFIIIGLFIFSGMGLQILLQLKYNHLEAGLFVGSMAVIYFTLMVIFQKNKGIFIPVIGVLAILAVSMIFLQSLIFGAHH